MTAPAVGGDRSLDLLRRSGEAFSEALAREQYRVYAGLAPTADFRSIYERFADVFEPDALALTREVLHGAPSDSPAHRSARLLLEWQAEGRVTRELAPLEEREIAWERSAVVVTADGRAVPYQRVSIELATTTDRAERLALDAARAALVAHELEPIRRERLQREREITERLALADGSIATFEALSGIAVRQLGEACAAFLRETQSIWDEVLPRALRRHLGIRPTEATRADALVLQRAPEHDAGFPAAEMVPAVRRQVREMGLDLTAGGRVHLDIDERPGKRARAFCAPVRVPQEVYLVLRPHGGHSDYATFLHELGHALHYASHVASLPFEDRWLGDASLTEAFAMLFDHRLHDRGWLARYTALPRAQRPEYLHASARNELHMLRRYAAKLLYELQLHGGATRWDQLPDLYVETLTAGTGFRYRRADAFVDVDARFYAARYLRAWQFQALLGEALAERFDEDWYRNPRAGPWMVEHLFGPGQRETADEMARRVTGQALSFAPLVRAIERGLA